MTLTPFLDRRIALAMDSLLAVLRKWPGCIETESTTTDNGWRGETRFRFAELKHAMPITLRDKIEADGALMMKQLQFDRAVRDDSDTSYAISPEEVWLDASEAEKIKLIQHWEADDIAEEVIFISITLLDEALHFDVVTSLTADTFHRTLATKSIFVEPGTLTNLIADTEDYLKGLLI